MTSADDDRELYKTLGSLERAQDILLSAMKDLTTRHERRLDDIAASIQRHAAHDDSRFGEVEKRFTAISKYVWIGVGGVLVISVLSGVAGVLIDIYSKASQPVVVERIREVERVTPAPKAPVVPEGENR
jgi:hypothetical protein